METVISGQVVCLTETDPSVKEVFGPRGQSERHQNLTLGNRSSHALITINHYR